MSANIRREPVLHRGDHDAVLANFDEIVTT
jgi:hypothetical protein